MPLKTNVKTCLKELDNINKYIVSILNSAYTINKLLVYKKDKQHIIKTVVDLRRIEDHINILDNRIQDNPDIIKE